jgi:hypothetical protein
VQVKTIFSTGTVLLYVITHEDPAAQRHAGTNKNINIAMIKENRFIFSFSLYPDEHQPG